MSFRTLKVEPVTRESFAPYGKLVGAGEGTLRTSDFYGHKVELWSPGQFVSDDQTTLSAARIYQRPLEVIWMERHFKHTQSFIPVGGRPFVAVLGAPTSTPHPDPETVRAFYFDGSAGAMLHLGVWHEFPFAVTASADVIVVLRKETQQNLEQKENNEAIGDDLEKRNLKMRLGFGFNFTLD
jgi:ureidoglycolate lyase